MAPQYPQLLSRASSDSPCKDIILKALTRLNEKATLRAAADELSIIVRALDQDSLSALVQSICSTTGAWEPKTVAKKECIRVLGQLPLQSCPVADVALQQHLPKILAYLKKSMQDTDSLLREATSEALAAYAQGQTRLYSCVVPGSSAAPVVKAVFDCLAEQKKESQMGASQALLKMSPFLGPLDKELVKLLLKLLRSASFLGTAQLLAAIASTDPELRMPVGLLKHGSSAFIPYLNHLVGQPSQRNSSGASATESIGASSGGGSTASSTISVNSKLFGSSGILGCLSSKDWAVRRAAADAMRAVVLLLGPGLEPEDCWGIGDPCSVTGRCLSALEDCRFDKVKEAREAAREAAALIHQLHRFVAEQGPDGDWPAWASSNLPYAGWQSPPQSAPSSPLASRSPGGSSFKALAQGHMSPIAQRFRRAAVDSDVVMEPGSRVVQQDSDSTAGDIAGGQEAVAAQGSAANLNAEGSLLPVNSHYSVAVADTDLAAEASSMSLSSSVCEGKQPARQHPQPAASTAAPPQAARAQLGSKSSSRPSSRPSSAHGSTHGSRPGSANGTGASSTRRSSVQEQQPLRKQASQPAVGCHSAPGYAAGTRSSAARGVVAVAGAGPSGAASKAARPLPCGGRTKGGASKPQMAGQWQGPTQQEWQLLQEGLLEQQQLCEQLQQQAAANQMQHEAVLQELQDSTAAAYAALQERVAALEVQVQRQHIIIQEQRQQLQQQQEQLQEQQQQLQQQPLSPAAHMQAATPGGSRSPTRCSSSPASSAHTATAARAALNSMKASAFVGLLGSPPAGALSVAAAGQQDSQQPELMGGGSSGCRLYKSAEWVTPLKAAGSSSVRKSLITVIDPLTGTGHRSFSGLPTPLSMQGSLKGCDSGSATPGDLESAYADALRGERGGVHLLRLIQKTGPVWSQLSSATCHNLLEVFIKHVRDGVMMHRVLPWLWRLADEDAGHPEVPEALQQQLLEALECCPAAEDLQAQEKVCLLLDTLKAVWITK